jgi:imidazole glycerol-phosphate synthase subunit HisH
VIAILDYGAGNLRSVANALHTLAAPYSIAQDAPRVLGAEKIILPGVGHFGQMMRALEAMRVRDALLARIRAGVPFLGICLGLQALFERSDEAPEQSGLGLLPGQIRRFNGEMRVPHMGWNEIEPRGNTLPGRPDSPSLPSRLLAGLPSRSYVYFAHSYYAPVEHATSATCSYGGVLFTAALECKNVFAVQFHPEKSGAVGRKLLQNFAELRLT